MLGVSEGTSVGAGDGWIDGMLVGRALGLSDGNSDGWTVVSVVSIAATAEEVGTPRSPLRLPRSLSRKTNTRPMSNAALSTKSTTRTLIIRWRRRSVEDDAVTVDPSCFSSNSVIDSSNSKNASLSPRFLALKHMSSWRKNLAVVLRLQLYFQAVSINTGQSKFAALISRQKNCSLPCRDIFERSQDVLILTKTAFDI